MNFSRIKWAIIVVALSYLIGYFLETLWLPLGGVTGFIGGWVAVGVLFGRYPRIAK